MEEAGEITFTFSKTASNEANYLQMYVDETHVWDVETEQAWAQDDKQPITFTTDLPAGSHVVTFSMYVCVYI